jgi:hypothetical protein
VLFGCRKQLEPSFASVSEAEPVKRFLWISGRLPSPLFSGDALYSAGVLKALQSTGAAEICLVGTRRKVEAPPPDLSLGRGITCVDVSPASASSLNIVRALFSSISKDARTLATPEFAGALDRQLERGWDWIVIDHANSSGLLSKILAQRGEASICYLAHNAEGQTRPCVAAKIRNPLRRQIMRLDAEKYLRLERRVVDAADVVLAITANDADYFSQFHRNVIVVPPIYLGATTPSRVIAENCPRSLVLVGSFDWVAKQENLERIARIIAPRLSDHGISLDVVGSVPDDIKKGLASLANIRFHGLVSDIGGILANSRGGLVAEDLGGGFKLKILDYAFNRVPIFGLREAMAGTSSDERSAMLLADDMESLGATIVDNINDLERLNQNQEVLFRLVSERFGETAGANRLQQTLLS